MGSKGDSYDNAAAESLNSLYKKELIDFHSDWKDSMDVTLATMEWVAWYNSERPHSYCGNVPPAEYEATFHRSVTDTTATTENQANLASNAFLQSVNRGLQDGDQLRGGSWDEVDDVRFAGSSAQEGDDSAVAGQVDG